MAQSYFAYVVVLGDHLAQIAHRFGVSADEVRDFPKNEQLARTRGDMSMLVAGDLLFVPKKPASTVSIEVGRVNSMVARIPKVEVGLRLVDDKGAIAGEAYTIEGLDGPVAGVTDGDGQVTFAAPVTARRVRILLAGRAMTFDVAIGGLDPGDEISGAQMRLAHLGLYGGAIHGQASDHFRGALRAFQRLHNLNLTGELDAVTRAKLVAKHGS